MSSARVVALPRVRAISAPRMRPASVSWESHSLTCMSHHSEARIHLLSSRKYFFIAWFLYPRATIHSAFGKLIHDPIIASKIARDPWLPQTTRIWGRFVRHSISIFHLCSFSENAGWSICPVKRHFFSGKNCFASSKPRKTRVASHPMKRFTRQGIVSDSWI